MARDDGMLSPTQQPIHAASPAPGAARIVGEPRIFPRRAKGRSPMPVPRPLRHVLIMLVLALVSLPSLLAAQAQATTGVVRGTVTDTAGTPLPNASVRLRNAETNAERVLTTNERGVYVATLLRVGRYDITARALGFQEDSLPGVEVRLGETQDASFALIPQVVQLEEITVAGAEPPVDVTKS